MYNESTYKARTWSQYLNDGINGEGWHYQVMTPFISQLLSCASRRHRDSLMSFRTSSRYAAVSQNNHVPMMTLYWREHWALFTSEGSCCSVTTTHTKVSSPAYVRCSYKRLLSLHIALSLPANEEPFGCHLYIYEGFRWRTYYRLITGSKQHLFLHQRPEMCRRRVLQLRPLEKKWGSLRFWLHIE